MISCEGQGTIKLVKENLMIIYIRNGNSRFFNRNTDYILDVAANLNHHIHSDEGLQTETSVLILFTKV